MSSNKALRNSKDFSVNNSDKKDTNASSSGNKNHDLPGIVPRKPSSHRLEVKVEENKARD